MTATSLTGAPLPSPFPGLRPFLPGEEHLFFGRESQVHTMVDKLSRARILAVVGSSGSGKSSLVNCGLRPALHHGVMADAGTTWSVAQFRPGGNPIRALAQTLAEHGIVFDHLEGLDTPLSDLFEATLRMSKMGVADLYAQAYADGGPNLLIVADQFEELFRFRETRTAAAAAAAPGSDPAQDAVAFVNLLLEARLQRDFPIYVVLTMRSDFLGDCAELPGLAEAINEGQYLVPRLTREERRMAIAGPIAVGDGEISPILVTQLVNDVGDNPDQLSVLQHALNRTWVRWQREGRGQGEISLDHYTAIGTMVRALDQHADKAYGELTTDRDRDICQRMFRALTDVASDGRGVRRPTTLGTLCALCEATEEEIVRVVDVFRKPSRSFLMPPINEKLGAGSVIDISHESLMRVWHRLKKWADEEARSARLYRRLTETAGLYEARTARLAQDPELQVALNWRESLRPSAIWAERYGGRFDSVMTFLDASETARAREWKEAEERQKRDIFRTRLLFASIGLTLLTLAVVALWFLGERARAAAERAQEAAERQGQAEWVQSIAAQREKLQAIEIAQLRAQVEALRAGRSGQVQAEPSAEDRAKANKDREKAKKVIQDELDKLQASYAMALKVQQAKAADPNSSEPKRLSADAIRRDGLFTVASGLQISRSSGANNPYNMFGARDPSPPEDIATFFADHLPTGALHWVEWQTPAAVKLASVQIFTRHDEADPAKNMQFQRAFNRFTFKVRRRDGDWNEVIDFKPPLPYGQTLTLKHANGTLLPAIKTQGISLALCFDVPSMSASEFRAEFIQATNWYGYSGPRVIKLDGQNRPCE